MKKQNSRDERQKMIFNQAGLHAFIVLSLLLFGNALLQQGGIVWAKPMQATGILLMLAWTVFLAEVVFRGAQFTQRENKKSSFYSSIGLSVLYLGLLALKIFQYHGERLWANGAFTDNGFDVVIWSWLTLWWLIYAIGWWLAFGKRRKVKNEMA